MTFGAPLFLIAVLAGAIPLLMHMINRQNAPEMHFSTLRFLRLSVQKTRRRKYVNDVVLLLLRIAAVTLIAIALARPAVHRLSGWFSGSGSTAVVLIVDNSASMATTDQDGQRWQVAVEAAGQVLDQLDTGDELALLVTNGRASRPSQGLLKNHENVRQVLGSCRISFERADLDASIQQARQLLRGSTLPNQEIYVITDMQANCWSEDPSSRNEKADESANETPVIVVDVSGARLGNSGLASIDVQAAAPVAGMPIRIEVDIQGDLRIMQKRRLELLIDGVKIDASPTLQIEPGKMSTYLFQMIPRESGLHRGEVRLDGEDACPADDSMFFAANIDPSFAVAVVKSAEHEIPYLDQAYYLERALAPDGERARGVQVHVVTPTALARELVSEFAVVFCVNLPVPDEDVAKWLAAYVKSGGNLVWICGDQVDPVAYSALDERLDGGLLPIRLTGLSEAVTGSTESLRIAFLDAKHPVVGPFAEPSSLYQSVQVLRYVKMAPVTGSSVRVLARLENGKPLLVQRNIGAGSVYFWGTSLHTDWTNLPLRPLFLPLISRLTFQLAGTNVQQPRLIAGAQWVLPMTGSELGSVEVVQPNNDLFRIQLAPEDDDCIRFVDTDQVGVYRVRIHRDRNTQLAAFAVNPDPDESSPLRISHEELEEKLGLSRTVFCDDPSTVVETIRIVRHGQSLWGPFLLLVLAALVVEAYLANRVIMQRHGSMS